MKREVWFFPNGMPFSYKLTGILYHFLLFLVLCIAFLELILGVYDGVGGLRQGVEGLREADGGLRRACVWLLGVCAELRRVRGPCGDGRALGGRLWRAWGFAGVGRGGVGFRFCGWFWDWP